MLTVKLVNQKKELQWRLQVVIGAFHVRDPAGLFGPGILGFARAGDLTYRFRV